MKNNSAAFPVKCLWHNLGTTILYNAFSLPKKKYSQTLIGTLTQNQVLASISFLFVNSCPPPPIIIYPFSHCPQHNILTY